MNIQALAKLLDGVLQSDRSDIDIIALNTLQNATKDEASFLANMKYKDDLQSCKAGVILVASDFPDDHSNGKRLIRVADPYLAFATLQRHFHPAPVSSGVRHPSAVVDGSAILAADVDVGALAVIGKGVKIGAGTIIESGCVIEDHVTIGEQCLLRVRSVVCHHCVLNNRIILQASAVIGSDGFGYSWTGSEHLKIPQIGRVVIEGDVEIGANTSIDRGALGDTVIGKGVKLDNLIQIGHNVEIGPYSIMASQVGISGSTKIGSGCQVGGQVGIAGHLNIGDGVKLAAKSGVISNLEGGSAYAGVPAMPHRAWLKMSVAMAKLPEIWKQMKKIKTETD
ncbi:MAG: UDP-3-O-(3-hydroxymyristoyl)glucosamine N-acyltransferase [Mariprofundaceae bacterium]